MKPPINTPAYSYVEYPSAVFSLERHEIFPYERFAYTVLRIGVEALHHRKLSDQIHISFSEGTETGNWWTFNAGIRPMDSLFEPGTSGFHVSTTPVAPLLLFGMSHYAAKSLLRENQEFDRDKIIAELHSFVQRFAAHFTQALSVYKTDGLASCIRRFTELAGVGVWDLNDCAATYDLLIQFIANHEIAHAYVGQFTENADHHGAREHRAFEIIVDTLATQWIYNHMIINTPDTDEYREFRGTSTHRESIYQNALLVLDGQILRFLVFAFASALANRGRVVLDGGVVHPHALLRCLIQHVHFMTLLQSNFSNHLTEEDFHELDRYYGFYMSIFAQVGFFAADDAKAFKDQGALDDFFRAYELVEEYDIGELKKCRELFRIAGSIRERMKSGGVNLL